MKRRIGITIVGVSLLISCVLVCVGCSPPRGYFTIDWGSAVMQPTFCLYRDGELQQPLGIGTITVWKVPRSKNQWELNQLWTRAIGELTWGSGLGVGSLLPSAKTVWDLECKGSDNFMKRLTTATVSCLTYGEVPPDYQEKMKAEPLESEQLYGVWIRGTGGQESRDMYFVIRLDDNGSPERLEYHQENFLITDPNYSTEPRDDLKLY